MAKRLKNLKPKQNKKMGCKYKCERCVNYDFDIDGPYGPIVGNECMKKELFNYGIETQKFCKDYKCFNSALDKMYYSAIEDDPELPF